MNDVSGFDINQTVMGALGIEIIEYTPEKVVAQMPVTSKTHQPFGLLHGGVSVVIAETVASAGSYQFVDANYQRAVGLEINANHIRSKASGMVHAIGVPIHVGKRTIIWDIRIYDEAENLICVSRCTMAVIEFAEKPVTD